MHSSGLIALLGSSALAAAAPTFPFWPFGGNSGYGSGNNGYGGGYQPPAYTPSSYTPPSYTPPSYTPPSYTPPSYTPSTYTPPSYTPSTTYTPPSYTPKPTTTYTPPGYTPSGYQPPPTTTPGYGYGGGNGGYGGGVGGFNPIGWLGGIIGGITGGIKGIFDITFFFGKKFDLEITLKDKTVIHKQISYLGGTALGELEVEELFVADVKLNLGFLSCEFLFKEEVDIDAGFDITSGWKHKYGQGNYGKYGKSAPKGVSAGATIKWLTVIGVQCNIAPPKGHSYPPGYTPSPGYGKPWSYQPPAGNGYGY